MAARRWKLPAPEIEDPRDALRAAIRAKRKAVEVAGTSLNGMPLATDETSLLKVNGAVALFDKDPTLEVIQFEAAPGLWVDLDRDTMTAIAVKIGRHVQAAFSRARALDAAAVAAAEADLADFDISTGWPV